MSGNSIAGQFTVENSGLIDVIYCENSWKAPERVAEVICTHWTTQLVERANATPGLLDSLDTIALMCEASDLYDIAKVARDAVAAYESACPTCRQ
jgi:hypothetical protein